MKMERILAVLVTLLGVAAVVSCGGTVRWNTTRTPHRVLYEVELLVEGEWRRALIYPGSAAGPTPLLLFFHGNTDQPKGVLARQASKKLLHAAWPEATVVYAEGSQVDANGLPTTDPSDYGWTLRFPYKYALGQTKDVEFVRDLLDVVERNFDIDDRRVFACGSSSGGFFTFSLSKLMPDEFAGFAVNGAYTWLEFEDAETVYHTEYCPVDPLPVDRAGRPRPILYVFGKQDAAFNGDGWGLPGWDQVDDSLSRATLRQLFARNGVNPPENFWAMQNSPSSSFVTFHPNTAEGEVVAWRLHNGGHSWPPGTSAAVVEFCKGVPFSSPSSAPTSVEGNVKPTDK